jgi:putative Ca2+/H+ antiporter (TMEM165/GDT1 family)
MESLLVSFAVTALAEIGDKTQLLALVLAARFRRPYAIIAGILIATLLNHGLASTLGAWMTTLVNQQILRCMIGVSFFGLAIWTAIASGIPPEETKLGTQAAAFSATVIGFFLAEMGDKTQLVTIALGARYANPVATMIGATMGVLLVDVPTVLVGCMARKIPLRLVQTAAAAILFLLSIASFISASGSRWN